MAGLGEMDLVVWVVEDWGVGAGQAVGGGVAVVGKEGAVVVVDGVVGVA